MGRQAGYTIIEVTLFLAITGLLIVAVISGFNGSISNNQRTDATRSLEAAIEKVYSSVRTGEATRLVDGTGKAMCIMDTAFPGASNECIIIGKLLYFRDESTIDVYNVIASIEPDASCTATAPTGAEALRCYRPFVLNTDEKVDTITPQWQAKVPEDGPYFDTIDDNLGISTEKVAFLRHPASEIVYVVPLDAFSVPFPATGKYEMVPASGLGMNQIKNKYANTKGQLCLTHEGLGAPRSYVRFNGGEGVGGIDTSESPLALAAGAPSC